MWGMTSLDVLSILITVGILIFMPMNLFCNCFIQPGKISLTEEDENQITQREQDDS
jgi:hypothetical protein